MPRILVPPEVLLAVSDQFSSASEKLEMNQNTLNQQIMMMMHSWDGTTKQRFFEDFQRARSEVKLTVEHMQVVSQELKRIAFKFIAADGMNKLGDPNGLTALLGVPPNSCPAVYPEPESTKTVLEQLEEQGEELWDGMVSGAKILGDSIADTASALIEDPIGTGGQMFYDATVGTAEEIIDTTVWGTKMIFDVGDTREKFDERLSAEQEKVNDMAWPNILARRAPLSLEALRSTESG
ncbi:WXG100 family type VII secretion target [Paenibacillus sp. DMB20]|uniref:WXG100 family type VII secretion target n=1 Tax=Paenibacillus sp. DMB20 TaxID=1642570 RepID=UPI00069C2E20|nr:WXG100 family type VII secretion target [Paenibacillus sp. DMB20]